CSHGVAPVRVAAPTACPCPAAVVVPPACECECESSADARAGLSDRPDITATARPTTATSGTAVSDRTGRLATLCHNSANAAPTTATSNTLQQRSAAPTASGVMGPTDDGKVREIAQTATTAALSAIPLSSKRRDGTSTIASAKTTCSQPSTTKNTPWLVSTAKCSPATAKWIPPAPSDTRAINPRRYRPIRSVSDRSSASVVMCAPLLTSAGRSRPLCPNGA